MRPTPKGAGWAKLSLGLSLLFAVAAFGYFVLGGEPLTGAVLAVIVVGAGLWEYRRKLQHAEQIARYEAEAEEQQRRDRQ